MLVKITKPFGLASSSNIQQSKLTNQYIASMELLVNMTANGRSRNLELTTLQTKYLTSQLQNMGYKKI